MQPTKLRNLVAIAVLLAVSVLVLARFAYASFPELPSYSPLTLVLVAIANGYLALAMRDRRKAGRPVRIEPLIAARYAALSKASSLIGSVFLGAYLGLLGHLAGDLDKAQPRADAKVAAAGGLSALVLVAAALVLERACRVPPRDDPDPEDGERGL